MRAVTVSRFGGPDVLEVVDVERPEPGPTEVLVRVHAAGVNPVDWKTRAGDGFASPADLPFVPGWDVSGVVEAVAPGVTRSTACHVSRILPARTPSTSRRLRASWPGNR